MTFNRMILIAAAFGVLAFTNPGHNKHREVLGPAFLKFFGEHTMTPAQEAKDWTFLPANLDYRNYFIFSTTRFPRQIATEGTPAQGHLTIGVLGTVMVLFPKEN